MEPQSERISAKWQPRRRCSPIRFRISSRATVPAGRVRRPVRRNATPYVAGVLQHVVQGCGFSDDGRTQLMRRLATLVPPLSASQLGLFRIAFGTGLLFVFVHETVLLRDPIPRELHRNYSALAGMAWAHWIAASGPALTTAAIVVYLALAAFVVGFWTRVAFLVVTAGFLVHALVVLQSSGVHNLGILVVTMICLLVVPWGDGLSLDARLYHSRRPVERSEQAYGFAIWLPGLTLGVSLLAAAVAKLTFGGITWVTEGAVKYHFVEDANSAPTTLGLWVASHEMAAIAVSLGAVAIEGLFILNVFRSSARWRALFALAGATLLMGFYVFHGLFWPAWWLLLLPLLPWQAVNHSPRTAITRSPALPWHYGIVVLALLTTQLYASLTRKEVEPVLTWFPMYANTWESTEQFDRGREERFSRFSFLAGAMDITDWVEDEGAWDAMVAAATRQPSELQESQLSSLRFLKSRYEAVFGTANMDVEVRRDREKFDWTSGRFVKVEHNALLAVVHLRDY